MNIPVFKNKEKYEVRDTYLPLVSIKKDYIENENRTSQNHNYMKPNSVLEFQYKSSMLFEVNDDPGVFILKLQNS